MHMVSCSPIPEKTQRAAHASAVVLQTRARRPNLASCKHTCSSSSFYLSVHLYSCIDMFLS